MSADDPKIIIIGVSGGSSSGKTTVSGLLKGIFHNLALPKNSSTGQQDDSDGQWLEQVSSLMIQEDDAYRPSEQIPITKMASDEEVMDWDCLEALDIPLLASCLRYVRKHGILPPRFVSRGTSNARLSDKIDGAVADLLRSTIAHRLVQARRSLNLKQPLRLVFMEGFMLYAPPWTESHPLRAIEEQLDARLFLPVTRSRMKERRGNRDDYLVRTTDTSFMSHDKDSLTDREKRREDDPSTLQDDQWQANMKIWHDPPNFVDEVVWPNYVANHLWIFAPDHVDLSNASTSSMSKMEMVDLVGEGSYTRKDTGVTVAPGNGEASVVELLEWAVDEVLKIIEAGK